MSDDAITFQHHPEHRLRVARFRGRIDDGNLLTAYAELIRQPDFDPTFNDLIDTRPCISLDLSADTLERIVAMFAPLDDRAHPTRLAIVATGDKVYGIGRLYQLLREASPEDVDVFREMEDALAWLRVDPRAVRI